MPLRARQADPKPYGVLLSGPPALPDQLLEEVAKWAGPIYADHWRRSAMHALMEHWALHVRNGLPKGRIGQVEWLREATKQQAREHVESEHWQRGEHVELAEMWAPLKGLTGNELRDYQEQLRWKKGPPLGVFSLCLTDANGWIDGATLAHIVASIDAARKASDIISELPPGMPRIPQLRIRFDMPRGDPLLCLALLG